MDLTSGYEKRRLQSGGFGFLSFLLFGSCSSHCIVHLKGICIYLYGTGVLLKVPLGCPANFGMEPTQLHWGTTNPVPFKRHRDVLQLSLLQDPPMKAGNEVRKAARSVMLIPGLKEYAVGTNKGQLDLSWQNFQMQMWAKP